jgi:carboxypeptidase Taq
MLSKSKSKQQAMREAELEGEGYQAWIDARTNNNFHTFEPLLQEILNLKKDIAKATRPQLSLYDGNIDMFERGMKSERLNNILNSAKVKLIPLLEKVSQAEYQRTYVAPTALQGGR